MTDNAELNYITSKEDLTILNGGKRQVPLSSVMLGSIKKMGKGLFVSMGAISAMSVTAAAITEDARRLEATSGNQTVGTSAMKETPNQTAKDPWHKKREKEKQARLKRHQALEKKMDRSGLSVVSDVSSDRSR